MNTTIDGLWWRKLIFASFRQAANGEGGINTKYLCLPFSPWRKFAGQFSPGEGEV